MSRDPVVDFYLYASHEVPTWLPIIAALRAAGADARFVLEPPSRHLARGSSPDPARGWRDDKDGSRATRLVDDDAYEQLQAALAAAGEVPIARLRPEGSVVSSIGARWLRAWSGARIRCMYGVGVVTGAWGHGEVNRPFDLVLAPGAFSQREIHRVVPEVEVAAVGYPKWARYRQGLIGQEDSRRALGIGGLGRPVLVWLPTWADHSSIDRYGDRVGDLADRFEVVMKPHHNSVRFERSRLGSLTGPGQEHPLQVVPTTTDLVTLLAAADLVVSDVRSGGLTEGLLSGRSVVALADPSQSPDTLHEAARDVVPLCTVPDDLAQSVDSALRAESSSGRAALVHDLFGPDTGDDDERAAEAILGAVRRIGRPWGRRLGAPGWRVAARAGRRVGR